MDGKEYLLPELRQSETKTMRASNNCDQMPLKKGIWSPEEDKKLIAYINRYGIWNWSEMPKAAGLLRSGKSCRLRWMNYLRPNIKRGNFTKEEEETIINLHEMLGNKWSAIAARLPGRTDNEIKNYWHTHLRKLLKNSINKSQEGINDDESLILETQGMNISEADHNNVSLSSTSTAPQASMSSSNPTADDIAMEMDQVNNNSNGEEEFLPGLMREQPFSTEDLHVAIDTQLMWFQDSIYQHSAHNHSVDDFWTNF